MLPHSQVVHLEYIYLKIGNFCLRKAIVSQSIQIIAGVLAVFYQQLQILKDL